MKIKPLLFALVLQSGISFCQTNLNCSSNFAGNFVSTELLFSLSETKQLCPVYFNFSRRLLKYSGNQKISGVDFLAICRQINDSAVQLQVARYDALSREKHKLGLIAVSGGFGAISLFCTSAAVAGQNNDILAGSLGFFGAVGVLMIPVCAIASGIPHQKRKEVLFRDLPIAYNAYVEMYNQTSN